MTVTRHGFVAIALLALAGCGLTPQGELARDMIRVKGATAADALVENALWVLCNAAPRGAVARRFGDNAEAARAYLTVCGDSAKIPVIEMPPPVPE